MPTVSVIYPRQPGAHFDYDYYTATHMPLVQSHWGDAIGNVKLYRGVPGPDGADPSYFLIALLDFTSNEALAGALGGPHAPEIIGDIIRFTDVQPTIQVNEAI